MSDNPPTADPSAAARRTAGSSQTSGDGAEDGSRRAGAWALLVALMAHNARLAHQLADEEQAHAEFIDFVAHELKQPMTAMQGYSKMLTLGIGGDLNDRQQEFVEVINANVRRMGKLVGDLLEISRLEAGRIRLNLAPVSILELMGEVLSSASDEIESRHHTLEQAIPGDLPPVWADRERLVQILTNLVRNAYMYTPEGGQIQIAAEVLEGTDNVQVSVTDTGIGLSPTDLLRLRERFFRADHDLVRTQTGTGLGLSIVRGLVELHGGELSIESEPGQGSVFAFTLPLAQERTA